MLLDSVPNVMEKVPVHFAEVVWRRPWRVSKGGRWDWRREEREVMEVRSWGSM